MIKAVIIDDEQNARNTLKTLLQKTEISVNIIAEADDVLTGKEAITKTKPNLIFLDVQLKTGTGFDILASLPNLDAEVIFITAYDDYAVKAFQMAAFGYLLKPLQVIDLRSLLSRFEERKKQEINANNRTRVLIENFDNSKVKKLVIQNVNGFRVLRLEDILYLQGEINYTRFFLKDGEKILTSKTLKEYDNLLSDFGFYRIHQSHLINLSHVAEYIKGEGGVVIMNNKEHLNISRRRKQGFIRCFLGGVR